MSASSRRSPASILTAVARDAIRRGRRLASTVTVEDVVEQAEVAGFRLVRSLWCGKDGTVRAKASGRHVLRRRLESMRRGCAPRAPNRLSDEARSFSRGLLA